MKRFRRKSYIVEAEQWFKPGDVPELKIKKFDEVVGKVFPRCGRCDFPLSDHGILGELEFNGPIICPGDWIVKTDKGDFIKVHPEDFEKNYERLE